MKSSIQKRSAIESGLDLGLETSSQGLWLETKTQD